MSPDYRRPDLIAIARAYAEARADLHEMHFRHLCELADVRRELDALHCEIAELRSIAVDLVRGLREQADADIAELRRKLEVALVRLHQREPATPLH